MSSAQIFKSSSLAVVLGLCCGACAPAVTTQPERLDFLEEKIDRNIAQTMKCEDATLQFEKTEEMGVEWYDHYTVEGCGHSSTYVTMVRQTGDYISWGMAPVPEQSEYEAAAEEQLRETAEFDLDCQELDVSFLHALVTPMQDGFRATLGVRGCDKARTYDAACGSVGIAQGEHEISCQYRAASASGEAAQNTQ